MASVAKWLRQRIVVPPLVGSSPIVRPLLLDNQLVFCVQTYSKVSEILEFEGVGLLDVTAEC